MEQNEALVELKVIDKELRVFESKLNKDEEANYYWELEIDIKEKLTQIFELRDQLVSKPCKFFTKMYRKIHTLKNKLNLYQKYKGEDLRIEIIKRRYEINIFVEEASKIITNEQGHKALAEIGKHFDNVNTCNFGRETFFKVLDLKPKLIECDRKYKKSLENATTAKLKAQAKYSKYLKALGVSDIKVIIASQDKAIKAYLLYCKISNMNDNLKAIQRAVRLTTGAKFLGISNTLYFILLQIVDVKIDRAKLILAELGVPEDSIEIAISKGIFYATKHEYLKDFSNILKLIDAKKQADFIRYNIGDLDDNHVGSINDTIKTYFRDNDLLDLSEEDMKKLVIEKFGLTKSFSVFGRRGHWRTNYQTGIKDIWINAHPVVKFVIK